MAGEPILIVDDTPLNLKLTRILLVNEGYKVMTAASAEEALELLRSYHPQLILADIQMPGMDGLELTRRIKQNQETRDISVVALTAFAMKGDEQKAVEAGCDGYITKPIDTRSLGGRIREHLNGRAEAQGAAPAAPGVIQEASGALPAAEMMALRRRFLTEGQETARQMLLDLDGQFNAADAAKKVHTWIGTGGLLGYSAISRLAREAEAVLLVRPLENDQLRDALTSLALAFNSPREARDAPLSESIVQALSGKRVALMGLPPNDAQRMCVALERTNSVPVFFEVTEPPISKAVLECHLAVIHVRPEMGQPVVGSRHGAPAAGGVRGQPRSLALARPGSAIAGLRIPDGFLAAGGSAGAFEPGAFPASRPPPAGCSQWNGESRTQPRGHCRRRSHGTGAGAHRTG